MKSLLPYLTVRNVKIVVTVVLTLASLFGVVAPEEATRLRNRIMVPLELIQPGTVDLI